MAERFTFEEAEQFFAEFYGGIHHFPGKIKEWGHGWCMPHFGDLATFDGNQLTRLVLLAHKKAYRVSIMPHHFKTIRICVWKREREGSFSNRHPTITEAIAAFEGKTNM